MYYQIHDYSLPVGCANYGIRACVATEKLPVGVIGAAQGGVRIWDTRCNVHRDFVCFDSRTSLWLTHARQNWILPASVWGSWLQPGSQFVSAIATKPAEYSWRQVCGAGALAGIGFTLSLFIAGEAFPTEAPMIAAGFPDHALSP
jgi:hypothetical protein